MGEARSTYVGEEKCIQGFGGGPDGNRPRGIPRRRWEDNIKMDIWEVEWGGMDWIELAQSKDSCLSLVIAVMNLRVS